MRFKTWAILLSLAWVVAGCELFGGRRGSAPDLLPEVPNTRTLEGQTIIQYLSSVADTDALKTAHPELWAAVEFTEGVVTCYQEIGAVAIRVYSDRDFALSAGMVAIVDRNAIADPGNLAKCLASGVQLFSYPPPAIKPCTNSYTLQRDNNEFYVAYVATTQEMCDAFCSKLEGCVKKQP